MKTRTSKAFVLGMIVGMCLIGIGNAVVGSLTRQQPRSREVVRVIAWRSHFVQLPSHWVARLQPASILLFSRESNECFMTISYVSSITSESTVPEALRIIQKDFKEDVSRLQTGNNVYGHKLWYTSQRRGGTENQFYLLVGGELLVGRSRWTDSGLGKVLGSEMGQIQAWFGPNVGQFPELLLDRELSDKMIGQRVNEKQS